MNPMEIRAINAIIEDYKRDLEATDRLRSFINRSKEEIRYKARLYHIRHESFLIQPLFHLDEDLRVNNSPWRPMRMFVSFHCANWRRT